MQLLLRKNIFKIYWIIVFIGLVVVSFDVRMLDIIFKPLLMPLLMAALYFKTTPIKGRPKIFIALFFSFCGDVLLLFENKGAGFFIGGLICFLITHIFYIAYFFQIKQSGDSAFKKHPYLIVIIALYTFGLLYLVWPNLHDLKMPVIIYACVISVMLFLSLCIPYKIGRIAWQLFVTGAIFFVLSDSLLALNKFYKPYTLAPFLVRITYCLAQFFIVKGFIRKRY